MCLKVKDIQNIMEQYAPLKFKESYDNVGLMVGNPEDQVLSILIALDCTFKVIEEAKEVGANLILTHHPLLFNKPSSITTETLLGKKIIKLISNNINVYSSHTNLDSVKGGINDIIMEILGFEEFTSIEKNNIKCFDDKYEGIGRITSLQKEITLKELCEKVKNKLHIPYLRYSGNDDMLINKVAVINGSGQSYLNIAKKLGAQCVITGDTTYHYVSDFTEENMAIIDAGHFGTEWPAMEVVARYLKSKIENKGFNNKIILSKNTLNPYKYK